MQKVKIIGLLAIAVTIFSCKEETKDTYKSASKEMLAAPGEYAVHPGKALLENKCNLCHSPTASNDEGRIAPPMAAVKAHYINEDTSKEEFIATLWDFVQQPSEDKAKMRGALQRFGLMPYQKFDKKEIELVGEYLYDFQIEEPAWFRDHWQGKQPVKGHGNKGNRQKQRQGHRL